MTAPSAASPRHHVRGAQSGFMLAEVMVSLVLVMIFVLGMNSFWVVTVRQFDDLALRQKAIFRLNSEMERLAGLYNVGASFSCTQVTDYGTPPANAGSYIATSVTSINSGVPADTLCSSSYVDSQRFIYSYASGSNATNWWITNDPNDTLTFSAPKASNDSNIEIIYRYVAVWNVGNDAFTTNDRNLVWLDRDHNLVAQISWDLQDIRSESDYCIHPARTAG